MRNENEVNSEFNGFDDDFVSVVNRELSEFFGDSVVLGCTHRVNLYNFYADKFNNDNHSLHSDSHHFYSIDFQSCMKPDFVFNLTRLLPAHFQQRFSFIFSEFMPFFATITYDIKIDWNRKFEENINKLLNPQNGVLLIQGSVPKKENQQLMHYRENGHFVVGKLNGYNDDSFVLVTSRKDLDLEFLVKSLNSDAQQIINKHAFQFSDYQAEQYSAITYYQFIQSKALEIIDRQIARLEHGIESISASLIPEIFRNSTEKNYKLSKLKALQLLKKDVEQFNIEDPTQNFADMINSYPILHQGVTRHVTYDALSIIIDLENYHLEKINTESKILNI